MSKWIPASKMKGMTSSKPNGGFRQEVQFWTVFSYGALSNTVCSKHRTLKAAIRAAKECEKAGGERHGILCVQEFLRGEGEK